jgi:hypothetical protein
VDSGCLPRPWPEPRCEWCGEWEHDKGSGRCVRCRHHATPREALADLVDDLKCGSETDYSVDTYGWERWAKLADAMVHAAARDAREAERKRCEGVCRSRSAMLRAQGTECTTSYAVRLNHEATEADRCASAIAALAGRE